MVHDILDPLHEIVHGSDDGETPSMPPMSSSREAGPDANFMAAVTTNAGLADVIATLVTGTYSFVGWGTGSTAAAATDTALETASAEARTDGTQSQVTTTATDDTMRVVATITSASTQSITEVVLFDASTAGTALLRAVHASTPLVNGESITYTVDFQLSPV